MRLEWLREQRVDLAEMANDSKATMRKLANSARRQRVWLSAVLIGLAFLAPIDRNWAVILVTGGMASIHAWRSGVVRAGCGVRELDQGCS